MMMLKCKQDCCGCNACVQICPKKCIIMQEDEEGFQYPHIDIARCIDCHLCERTCPVLNRAEAREPIKVYAAINKNEEIRLQSSSGGIFSALAEKTIHEGGVVFGARFNKDWEVVHDYAETMDGIVAFRGSKYVQSRIGSSFSNAEKFLKAGRKVLFSGTPCQIAGLHLFLRKEYANLLTVDFICHGVPSPAVWRRYLNEEVARQGEKNTVLPYPISKENTFVEGISFRNKRYGWKKFSFALTLSATNESGEKIQFCSYMPLTENLYLKGFMSNLYLRPSCYNCPAKCLKSKSDITFGDFWNIGLYDKQLDDNKGLSVVLVNNNALLSDIQMDNIELIEMPEYNMAQNFALQKSVIASPKRDKFYEEYGKGFDIFVLLKQYTHIDIKKRLSIYYTKIKRRIFKK